ncbi:MAG TPA: c-type cytochrome [Dokdonella sp.]|uniref:c-type cytochrome n=1 Tax=Dokdonella sp. TaxID=2291710 RepID=UPI002D80D30C|nr:c-type cytochrome [Dokdonella sp.]HET9031483.1 c-type cytochrome [Dokdonella sp.]
MKPHAGKLTIAVFILALLALGTGLFVWSGLYNIGADDPHTKATYALLETLRERSIDRRASKLRLPDLSDPAKAIQGAGNYNAMCVGCHLAPGMEESELSKGLYPAPPNLSKVSVDVAQAFWVIKHGIKASGMPAWGKSMDDVYIWNMAAFLQVLPTLDDARYDDMVARSGGHSHGGGESDHHDHHEEAHGGGDMNDVHDDEEMDHSHESGEAVDHDEDTRGHDHDKAGTHAHEHAASSGEKTDAATMTTHMHADGTVESHPAKTADHKDQQH